MSTDISGVDPGGVTAQPVVSEQPPPAAAPTRPSFWRRPVGIVLISLAAVGFGMVLLIGLMVFFAFRSAEPLDQQVMAYDFAVEGDRAMVVEDGLSWDQSNGTLNLYPTDDLLEGLDFDLPAASDAVKVEATLIEPAYADPAPMLWGIEAFSSTSGDGVMLLCAPGATMYLADSRTGEPLPVGDSDFACEETMDMALQVDGRLVMFGPDPDNMSLYSGDIVYGDLDTAAVVVAAEEPDQVLRVSKIAAYQR